MHGWKKFNPWLTLTCVRATKTNPLLHCLRVNHLTSNQGLVYRQQHGKPLVAHTNCVAILVFFFFNLERKYLGISNTFAPN